LAVLDILARRTTEAVRFDDLPAMPKWRLLSVAPWWRMRLPVHRDRNAAMAMPHVRPAILRPARGSVILALCPLPKMRELRSRAHRAGSRGAGHSGLPETLSGVSGLPLRPLPAAILQCAAISQDSSVDVGCCTPYSPRQL